MIVGQKLSLFLSPLIPCFIVVASRYYYLLGRVCVIFLESGKKKRQLKLIHSHSRPRRGRGLFCRSFFSLFLCPLPLHYFLFYPKKRETTNRGERSDWSGREAAAGTDPSLGLSVMQVHSPLSPVLTRRFVVLSLLLPFLQSIWSSLDREAHRAALIFLLTHTRLLPDIRLLQPFSAVVGHNVAAACPPALLCQR